MNSTNDLDLFGKFLVENLRDRGINFAERILKNESKAPVYSELQSKLSQLTSDQKESVKIAVLASFDSAIHDFLFAIQDVNHIQILVEGKNIVDLSDGIHGESFSDEGWNAKFSKYTSLI